MKIPEYTLAFTESNHEKMEMIKLRMAEDDLLKLQNPKYAGKLSGSG